ncbi:hypothetical protein C8J56DRAFT_314425 [Mycena floridula]|nr:hypothetical protein C8J56DRAFT_314425 [Mycena floridula]
MPFLRLGWETCHTCHHALILISCCDILRFEYYLYGRPHLEHCRCSHFVREITVHPLLRSILSMERYHSLSDKTMNSLLEELEDIVDQHGNPSHEVDYHSGVLTLRLGEAGTYVINKQPPNKQIWLSSPFSGPKRFDYSEADDSWRYARDGQSMSSLLDEELGRVLEEPVKLLAKPAS